MAKCRLCGEKMDGGFLGIGAKCKNPNCGSGYNNLYRELPTRDFDEPCIRKSKLGDRTVHSIDVSTMNQREAEKILKKWQDKNRELENELCISGYCDSGFEPLSSGFVYDEPFYTPYMPIGKNMTAFETYLAREVSNMVQVPIHNVRVFLLNKSDTFDKVIQVKFSYCQHEVGYYDQDDIPMAQPFSPKDCVVNVNVPVPDLEKILNGVDETAKDYIIKEIVGKIHKEIVIVKHIACDTGPR